MMADDASTYDLSDAPVAASDPKPAATKAEAFSPALAALTRPPKVGDTVEHDGKHLTIIGTTIRGPGDFSVLIEGGALALHSR